MKYEKTTFLLFLIQIYGNISCKNYFFHEMPVLIYKRPIIVYKRQFQIHI